MILTEDQRAALIDDIAMMVSKGSDPRKTLHYLQNKYQETYLKIDALLLLSLIQGLMLDTPPPEAPKDEALHNV